MKRGRQTGDINGKMILDSCWDWEGDQCKSQEAAWDLVTAGGSASSWSQRPDQGGVRSDHEGGRGVDWVANEGPAGGDQGACP